MGAGGVLAWGCTGEEALLLIRDMTVGWLSEAVTAEQVAAHTYIGGDGGVGGPPGAMPQLEGKH